MQSASPSLAPLDGTDRLSRYSDQSERNRYIPMGMRGIIAAANYSAGAFATAASAAAKAASPSTPPTNDGRTTLA